MFFIDICTMLDILVETFMYRFFLSFVWPLEGDPIIKRVPLTGLTPPYCCACPRPGSGFPASYVSVYKYVYGLK